MHTPFHRLIAALVCLLITASISFAGALSQAELAKLHPSLRKLVTLHAASFSGLRVGRAPGEDRTEHALEVGVLVHTRDAAEVRAAGIRVQSELPGVLTARISSAELETLAKLHGVQWVDPGRICEILTDASVPETGARLLHTGFLNGTKYTGKGVIVLVYDTGIDFTHMDFRDPSDNTRSRILAIWDQTLTAQAGEAPPSGFSYGVEYDKAAIEKEIAGITSGAVREQDINGHGTHVAGIAAGNGLALPGRYTGMAPEADIVVVKGGNGTFEEVNMIDGLAYADAIGKRFGKPVVVNWSIGGQDGPHDGTSPYEIAVDNFTATAGHVACISAGNDGANSIHRSGVLFPGLVDTIWVDLPAYTPKPGALNDDVYVDGYLRSGDTIAVEIISPGGIRFSGAGVCPDTTDGTIMLVNGLVRPTLYRHFAFEANDAGGVRTPASGRWRIVVKNPGISPVSWDVWKMGTVGGKAFTLLSGDNNKSVGMPATSIGAISVGASVTKWSWPSVLGQYVYNGADRTRNIATFSSIGPTADGRVKPDLVAPGQGIIAALSSSADTASQSSAVIRGNRHWLLRGTSMAAPHVTGACALLLQANSSLTASQIKSILQSSATVDFYTGSVPNMTWGSGKLDVLKAMAAVTGSSTPVNRTLLRYDTVAASYYCNVVTGERYAVRITPTSAGQVTGFLIDVNPYSATLNPVAGSGNLVCELYANQGGAPSARLGGSVAVPLTTLSGGALNYVLTWPMGVAVTPGTDYFAVVSVSSPGDTLRMLADQGTAGTRSKYWNGSSWGSVSYNYRIRVVVTGSGPTGIAEALPAQPLEFALAQNYPNPFNPATAISYTVPVRGQVRLTLFDLLGREVATLVNGEQAPGTYTARWEGRTSRGALAGSGVYFYRLEAVGRTLTRKCLLVK